ncbi:O-methyltransferase family protein [Forsythia ovata]|uniref:O-methyltransferase family protein n=1 Tax=Forsythia ovata TaxID=205694 RepID=A0ABD1U689_9LAMI
MQAKSQLSLCGSKLSLSSARDLTRLIVFSPSIANKVGIQKEMALPHGGEKSTELLNAQAHVWNHIFNFINSMSLKCAVQLGILDIIHKHGKPMTLTELVKTFPMNKAKAQSVPRLMRILIHLGFFMKAKISKGEEETGYWITPASRLLLKDEHLSVAPFLLAMLDPVLTKPWYHLSAWFENENSTPFDTAHGRMLWEHAGQEPRLNFYIHKYDLFST